MMMGFLFLTLSLPTLLNAKHQQHREEWQHIRYGLRLLPGKSQIPVGLRTTVSPPREGGLLSTEEGILIHASPSSCT